MTMPSASHDRSSPGSGAGQVLRWVCVGLAGLAVAGAITIVVLPLPNPAAGGTCGPGRGAEPAIAAFFDPLSIGAGVQPPGGTLQNYQWQAFVGECQSATNARMVDALALLVLAAFFGLAVPPLVRRAWHDATRTTHGAPPGWYADPADPRGWRWWDGRTWSHQTSSAWRPAAPPGSARPPWPPAGATAPAGAPDPPLPTSPEGPPPTAPEPTGAAPSPPPTPWSAAPSSADPQGSE